MRDLRSGRVEDGCFFPAKDVTMHLPMDIPQFSDFYCSLEHASNVCAESAPTL